MKAIVYHTYGDESVLGVEEVPEPKVGADRALVKVRAAGVNPVDYHVRSGVMDSLLDVMFPVTPGWDVSGTVERVGYLAEGFSKGDEVMGYAWMDFLHHGSYAEYMAVPLRTIVHKPTNLSWEEAAALPLAGLTAYQAIKKVGIRRGDTVLAHGVAGGTGSLGIQILQILGAQVIGTASTANHEFVADLGATPVAYGEGLDDAVRNLAPDGVDVIVDFHGNGSLEKSRHLLHADRSASNMVTIADGRAAIAMGAHVIGVQPNTSDLQQLADWAGAAQLRVPVTHRFPMHEAAQAHELSASGHTRGKIVITVDA